jgi:hypothetical protein
MVRQAFEVGHGAQHRPAIPGGTRQGRQHERRMQQVFQHVMNQHAAHA